MNKAKEIVVKATKVWDYSTHGVWSDTRNTLKVKIVKTLNIVVNAFFNSDIQSQACALTYRTMLAIVPMLALIFAIGRGFGFQNLLQDQLFKTFPAQKDIIGHALVFVDSYLNQASEGIFVGVGIIFLLWTLISLIGNVEDTFNHIWGVKQGRAIWRKLTDYSAMFLILPILMICGSGLQIFMSSSLQSLLGLSFLTPMIEVVFEIASFLIACLFFAAMFVLIPNTRVNFYNAMISGLFAGTGFIVLQWLFLSGQLYVAKYNAIYGSFSFLPLLLLWLQLVWVITLTGCLISYAMQSIFQFTYNEQVDGISREYYEKVAVAIATAVTKNFVAGHKPITTGEVVKHYGIPIRLANMVIDKLCDMRILSRVIIDGKHEITGLQPSVDPSQLTLSYLLDKLDKYGSSNFIPRFKEEFPGIEEAINAINTDIGKMTSDTRLADLDTQLHQI